MVIGAIERSVTVDNIDYFWQEYLLYHPRDGFLSRACCADNHWTRVKGIPAGAVEEGHRTAMYGGRSFRKFFNPAPRPSAAWLASATGR